MLIDAALTQKIHETHRVELDNLLRAYKLGKKCLDSVREKGPAASHKDFVAWLLLSRTTTALRSVTNLFLSGAEIDAMAVFRTIVEVSIDFDFIWAADTDARIEKFLDHQHVVSERRDRMFRDQFPEVDFSREERARFERFAAEHPNFEFKTYDSYAAHHATVLARVGDIDQAVWWAGFGVKKRVAAEAMRFTYHLAYRMGCDASHSGGGMVAGMAQPALDDPQMPQGSAVLLLTMVYYVHVLQKMTGHFGLDQAEVWALAAELGIQKPPASPPNPA